MRITPSSAPSASCSAVMLRSPIGREHEHSQARGVEHLMQLVEHLQVEGVAEVADHDPDLPGRSGREAAAALAGHIPKLLCRRADASTCLLRQPLVAAQRARHGRLGDARRVGLRHGLSRVGRASLHTYDSRSALNVPRL